MSEIQCHVKQLKVREKRESTSALCSSWASGTPLAKQVIQTSAQTLLAGAANRCLVFSNQKIYWLYICCPLVVHLHLVVALRKQRVSVIPRLAYEGQQCATGQLERRKLKSRRFDCSWLAVSSCVFTFTEKKKATFNFTLMQVSLQCYVH